MRGDTLMTPDRTAIQVRNSGYGRAGIGRSSGEDYNTERHEKAPVRCPSRRLATLQSAMTMVSHARHLEFLTLTGRQ